MHHIKFQIKITYDQAFGRKSSCSCCYSGALKIDTYTKSKIMTSPTTRPVMWDCIFLLYVYVPISRVITKIIDKFYKKLGIIDIRYIINQCTLLFIHCHRCINRCECSQRLSREIYQIWQRQYWGIDYSFAGVTVNSHYSLPNTGYNLYPVRYRVSHKKVTSRKLVSVKNCATHTNNFHKNNLYIYRLSTCQFSNPYL